MKLVETRAATLATQAFGDPRDPAVILVMGATASMLGWPDGFCTALADERFFVIRFDHRDTGQSTTGPAGKADYAVEDMAEDVVGILDAYGLPRAHLVGMSLGGYIAQMLAISHPGRVASLTLIASEPLGWTGDPLPSISPEFLAHFGALGTLDWSDPTAVADFLVESDRLCTGSAHAFDRSRARDRVIEVLSRTASPASMFNHATLTTRKDWTGKAREIRCPTLVVHGDEDTILPLANGRAIAATIPGAAILVLAGTGHELPPPVLPGLARRIAGHARQAR
jgi:pimeloyl-ACP methyl ester carboxylesterase